MNHQVKILHSSCCANDTSLKTKIEEATKRTNFQCDIQELSDLQDTLHYGTTNFPSLVVDNYIIDLKMFDSSDKLDALFEKLNASASCCN